MRGEREGEQERERGEIYRRREREGERRKEREGRR